MRKLKRKGVSPVIATVILVVVAITVALAVTSWMGGIRKQFTLFEKIEIGSATYGLSSGDPNNTVTIKVRNTGTIAINTTEAEVRINNETKKFNVTSGEPVLDPEKECTITIYNTGWISENKYTVMIVTENIFMKETTAP